MSVVLPESMCAEMPMLRMRSRGMRVAKGFSLLFRGCGGLVVRERPTWISTTARFIDDGRTNFVRDPRYTRHALVTNRHNLVPKSPTGLIARSP